MIPHNDKRIDLAKLHEAVKVILECETEMEEPQQWYDSPGKAVKEAIDYLVAAREEVLPILRVLAACGDVRVNIGSMKELRRWVDDNKEAAEDVQVILEMNSVRHFRGIEFEVTVDALELRKNKSERP